MNLKIAFSFPLKKHSVSSGCLTTSAKKRPHIKCGLHCHADNFFLPFNLLEAKTFLPPGVLILDLKP